MVTNKESIEILRELLEIYSPSYEEKNVSDYIFSKLNDLGFNSVSLDKVGNVIGRISKDNGKKLLLCGHMDTVPGKISTKVEDNKIYGRGAVDAKSSLASMMLAASNIKDIINSGEIIFVAVVREEADGAGINELIKNKLSADYAIFGEPSGTNGVAVGYKGKLDAKIKVASFNVGHSSMPWVFENAIDYAFKFVESLRNNLENKQDFFNSITICPTKITGGETSNVIPKFCEVNLDIRVPPSISASDCAKLIEKEAKEFNLRNKNIEVKVDFFGDMVDAYQINVSEPLVRAIVRSILEVVGRPVKLIKKSGTCDINPYYSVLKVPSIAYGPGDSKLSHTDLEYVKIDEFLNSIRIIEKTITLLL
ncbi:MAG: M20/M25/M40 family metallo-hydrolase [Candidatus Brockarchaeota archaeon]|nr:M20/M25/M40 family metallo-hydrolase [Candidatus Brockarchaeota archaeon]